MGLDLYSVYVYNYSKEYLFSRYKDIGKIKSLSDNSICKFVDGYNKKYVIAKNIIEFFNYLKNRECYKVDLIYYNKKNIILKFSFKFINEYWICKTKIIDDKPLSEFSKIYEEVWESFLCEKNIESEIDFKIKEFI